MQIAILDGRQVAKANEESEEDAVDEQVVPKLVAEGDHEDRQTDPDDGELSSYPVTKLQLPNVTQRHSHV
jgi:hypothetical protein